MEDATLAITVDVEFLDSIFLFRDRASERMPEDARRTGVAGLESLVNLLERYDVEATFFTLGEIIEQVPEVISDIAEQGHEIASHGYSKSHPDLRECTRESVREELGKSKRVIEECLGRQIEGFRAPAFTVNDTVFEVMEDVGYSYDSSVVPCRRIPGFYGMPDAPHDPFLSESWLSTTGFVEFPVATAPVFRLPLSGAWMRLLGRRYSLWGIRNHMKHHPVTVLYIHPWELVDLPDFDAIPRRTTWRTGEFVRDTLTELVREHNSHIETLGSLCEEYTSPQKSRQT